LVILNLGIIAQGGGLLYFVTQCFRRFHYAERHMQGDFILMAPQTDTETLLTLNS